MLSVSGLVAIYSDDIKESNFNDNKGVLFYLKVCTLKKKTEAGSYYVYPTELWVPADRAKKVKDLLKKGQLLEIHYGEWIYRGKQKEDSGYEQFASLKLSLAKISFIPYDKNQEIK